MPLPAMSLAVVGVHHPNKDKSNRLFEVSICKPGERIELRPEPKNIADENAVAVYSERGVQIGYLTAERCGRIGRLMRDGVEIQTVFQVQTSWGSWIRATFDGSKPLVDLDARAMKLQLPTVDGVDANKDFWPDPDWDE